MQILQWLFKVAQEEVASKFTTTNKKQGTRVKKAEVKNLVLSKRQQPTYTTSDSFTVLLRRGNSRECFYHSLNLKRLGSFRRREECTQRLEGKQRLGMAPKADTVTHVGNKVLPITDAAPISASIIANYQCWSSEKKDELQSDKNKAITRMKELWRWAATAKSDKGGNYIRRKVMNFRSRGTTKASLQDDQWSLSSPKISFRWETDSCSTTTSAYSAFSLPSSSKNDRRWNKPCSNDAVVDVVVPNSSTKNTPTSANQDDIKHSPRPGSWITTDDDFVVLEL